MTLKLDKKKVNGTEYYSLWLQENNNRTRLANIGTLEKLRVILVKAEKLDNLTKKYGEILTKLQEEENKEND